MIGQRVARMDDFFRHRVVPATAPGIAAANPPNGQQASLQSSMNPNRIQRVLRTTGSKAATARWPGQSRQERGNRPSIDANRKYQDMLRRIHCALIIPPRLSAESRSFSTAARPFRTIDCCATKTRSTGWARSCWCKRKTSRRSRRARARITAPPNLRVVMTPTRGTEPCGITCQFAIRQPEAIRRPSRRTRAKSRCCLRRIRLPSGKRGVPAVILRATALNRGQTLATDPAAVGKDGPAASG
jgi:hypothetical protein